MTRCGPPKAKLRDDLHVLFRLFPSLSLCRLGRLEIKRLCAGKAEALDVEYIYFDCYYLCDVLNK